MTDSQLLDDYFTEEQLAVEVPVGLTMKLVGKPDAGNRHVRFEKQRTVQRWRRARVGPPVTFLGKTPLYHKHSAREWLRSREQRPVRTLAPRRRVSRPAS
jgi:hypothetical protein